jgi:hypothetical protein
MIKTIIILSLTIISTLAQATDNADMLKNAEAGKLKALDQAFVLRAKSDGAAAEDIDIAIGKSILHNPKNFLIALWENRSGVQRLDALLGNLGPDYVDDFKKQKIELEKRLAAIHSVRDPAVKKVRAECEEQLKRLIAERKTGG